MHGGLLVTESTRAKTSGWQKNEHLRKIGYEFIKRLLSIC